MPCINPDSIRTVAGFVGAGGNVGGVVFGIAIQIYGYRKGLGTMGISILVSMALSVGIKIKDYSVIG